MVIQFMHQKYKKIYSEKIPTHVPFAQILPSSTNNPLYYCLIFQGIFGPYTNQQKYEIFFSFQFLWTIYKHFLICLPQHNIWMVVYHDLLTSTLLMRIYIDSDLSLLTNNTATSNFYICHFKNINSWKCCCRVKRYMHFLMWLDFV